MYHFGTADAIGFDGNVRNCGRQAKVHRLLFQQQQNQQK